MLSYNVLGQLEIRGLDGAPVTVAGVRQRSLLALLLAHRGQVVASDTLADLLFADRPPAHPAAALQSQISRLRRSLGDSSVISTPRGYAVPGAHTDADRFEELVDRARNDRARAPELLGSALTLWRGSAYGEFPELDVVQREATRLDALRMVATEERAEALTAAGRAGEAVPDLGRFVADNPLRERAHATLMRALYSSGRHAEALRHYSGYRRRLADELGLAPSGELQRLELDILRHSLEEPAPTSGAPATMEGLAVRYVRRGGGAPLAVGTIGDGAPVVAVPCWVTSLDQIAAGRDPRASLLEHLAERTRLTLYDRPGCGLSRDAIVTDHGLDAGAAELEAILEQVSGPATLIGVCQSGPIAIAVAARRPDLVRGLVLLGSYASGPAAFPSVEMRDAAVDLVRAHSRIGTGLIAGLFRPDASAAASRHLASVMRDCADPQTAADYLAAVYTADVSHLLPQVTAPALVMHYRNDRLVPFRGGQQLASGLPAARFIPFDGDYHLPHARDLTAIADTIVQFAANVTAAEPRAPQAGRRMGAAAG